MTNKKEKIEDPLKINPQVEAALKNTKEKMAFVANNPPMSEDFYCWKHGNIGTATMLMAVGGEILSNHCLYCLSELLLATVGNVVSSQDFLKTQKLITSLAQQPKDPHDVPPSIDPTKTKKE